MRGGVLIALCFSVFFGFSCKKFEYDPNQSESIGSETDLNQYNIDKILASPGDDVITLALIGDSHIYYDGFEKAIGEINKIPEVDFVVHAGDISDHGYLQEFERGISYLKKLNKPYVTVVGNHDLVANGIHIYRKMFGPTNFSFVYKDVQFIFFDSNSREYGFPGDVPDVGWIEKEINKEQHARRVALVSHVPYFNSDYDTGLIDKYKELLESYEGDKEILISMSGHQHVFYEEQLAGIPHIGPGSSNNRIYYIIRIGKGSIAYERKNY